MLCCMKNVKCYVMLLVLSIVRGHRVLLEMKIRKIVGKTSFSSCIFFYNWSIKNIFVYTFVSLCVYRKSKQMFLQLFLYSLLLFFPFPFSCIFVFFSLLFMPIFLLLLFLFFFWRHFEHVCFCGMCHSKIVVVFFL